MILKLIPDASFAYARTVCALIDINQLFMMKTVAESNAQT